MANGNDTVRRLVDAANARDWEALLAVCAPDVSLIHPLAPVPYQGRDRVREFFVSSVTLFPDQYLHVDALLAEGDVAALEGRVTATEEGEPTVTPCAFFFTLRAGLVHQIRMYDDTATMEGGGRGVKVFISTDFEGTSGIVAWEQTIEGNAEYAHGRALLTAEVNAAIDGARAAGAIQLVVNDAHHNMRNLRADELLGEATLVSGRHKPLYMMQGLDGSFDAVFFVSYHGSISSEAAILSHTYNPRAVYEARLDGQVVGESALNALVAAHYGVPIVLVTGDAATARESEWFAPAAERVVVKDAISRYAASNLHPDAARRLIRAGAQRALERLSEARAPTFARPARLDIQFLTADMAEMAAWLAGVERRGPRTVALEDDDALALYKRFVTIIYLTRSLVE